MKNNIITLLDFDRTLFNTDIFLLKIKNIFTAIGINKDKFTESYKKLKPYSIKKHLSLLNINAQDKSIVTDKLNTLISNTNKFLFPDTIKFLNFLKKSNIEIFLVTYGNKEFQNNKIKNSNIENLLDKVIITATSQNKINIYKTIANKNQNKEIIIIDDLKINTKEILNNISGIKAIQIDRNKKNKTVSYLKNFYKINSLNQAEKIISQI